MIPAVPLTAGGIIQSGRMVCRQGRRTEYEEQKYAQIIQRVGEVQDRPEDVKGGRLHVEPGDSFVVLAEDLSVR